MSESNERPYAKFQFLYDKGYSDGHIAQEVGCSKHSVQRWRREHGLVFNRESGYVEKKPGTLLCHSCIFYYRNGNMSLCDYLYLTGRLRKCKPATPGHNQCEKYQKKIYSKPKHPF